MRLFTLTAMLLLAACITNAQTSIVKIGPEIRLPKDSLESERLISSLNQFLIAAEKNAKENEWVFPSQFLQTSVLLDEIEGIQKSEQREDDSFYKPHLIDASPIEDEQYFVQISYLGILGETPVTRANIELVAHKVEDKYLFSSPLIRNTRNWKTVIVENMTIHYQGTLDVESAIEYQQFTAFCDERLNLEPKEVVFYLIEEDLLSQRSFGLPYKMDYNGRAQRMSWSVVTENQELQVINESRLNQFDPHDLWHARLSRVKPRSEVNHSVDEGIAVLYGGTWGLSWEELFQEFQNGVKFDRTTDWLKLREERAAFDAGARQSNTDFMINGLLVKKLENEKGFAAVWELLNAKEEEVYFETLERLMGITKDNYNKEVWRLVKEESQVIKAYQL